MNRPIITFLSLFVQVLYERFGAPRMRTLLVSAAGLVAIVGLTVLTFGLDSYSAKAGLFDFTLPPRAPVSTGSEFSQSADSLGVRIHLVGEFDSDWDWDATHWQSGLWHEVEWTDPQGTWTRVDGWQGEFDVVYQENGLVVARKEFWAANGHAGTGPFRWQTYDRSTGRLLGTSEPFYLPDADGDIVTIRMRIVK